MRPTPPKDALTVISPPSAMARLQRLHAAAGRPAEEVPEIIANPDVARGLKQALIEAMVGCFRSRIIIIMQRRRNPAASGSRARGNHQQLRTNLEAFQRGDCMLEWRDRQRGLS
jgi:hypothetical protein